MLYFLKRLLYGHLNFVKNFFGLSYRLLGGRFRMVVCPKPFINLVLNELNFLFFAHENCFVVLLETWLVVENNTSQRFLK